MMTVMMIEKVIRIYLIIGCIIGVLLFVFTFLKTRSDTDKLDEVVAILGIILIFWINAIVILIFFMSKRRL